MRHNKYLIDLMVMVFLWFVLCIVPSLSSDSLLGLEEDLLRASARNNYRLVEILLKEGADIHCKDPKSGFTPLHIASRNGHYGIVEILLQYGANPNKKDIEFGFTPLLVAAYHGNHSIAKLLLDRGANPNEQETKTGITALHIASQKGFLDIVKLLIERKADYTVRDSRGRGFLDKGHILVRDYYKGITVANREDSLREGCRAIILDLNEIGFISEELSRKGQGILFERIYNAYINNSNFDKCTTLFLDTDSDKFYWIGLFLFDEEYSTIKNFSMAKEIIKRGMEFSENKSIGVSLHFIYGLLQWRDRNKKEAKIYFEKAYSMSEKYPGSIPALSLDEKVEIDKFMGFTE